MRSLRRCLVALTAAGALLVPAAAAGAAGLEAAQPFPTNLLTVADPSQPTGLHVALPTPDCTTNPTDCADLAVIDGLDGFNLQPRISVPFSAPIDLATVSSSTSASTTRAVSSARRSGSTRSSGSRRRTRCTSSPARC